MAYKPHRPPQEAARAPTNHLDIIFKPYSSNFYYLLKINFVQNIISCSIIDLKENKLFERNTIILYKYQASVVGKIRGYSKGGAGPASPLPYNTIHYSPLTIGYSRCPHRVLHSLRRLWEEKERSFTCRAAPRSATQLTGRAAAAAWTPGGRRTNRSESLVYHASHTHLFTCLFIA